MAGAGGKEVGRISIRVVPDTDRFREELKAKLEEIEKGLKVRIKVDLDSNGIREKIKAETEGLKDSAKVKIKSDLDQNSFDDALARVKAISRLADTKVNIRIEDKLAEAKLAEAIGKLKAEAALAHIKLNVDLDTKRAEGFFSRFANQFTGVPGSGGFGGLGVLKDQTALIAVAVVAFLAPALALLSGLLVSLPALIASVVVPLGTLALGFKGIEKAAEAAGLLGFDKKGKAGIGPAMKSLMDTMSQKFQDGFTPIFQRLAPMLPAIGNALLPIADRIIEVGNALTDVVTSPAGMQAFQSIISGISDAMKVATPGIKSLSEGLLNLIAGGSKNLPKFAGLFTEMGDSFSKWVTKITTEDFWGTSPLDRAMTNFVNSLREIGKLIGELGKQGFDFLKDPKFGDKMKQFIADVRTFVKDTLPGLKGTFESIAGSLNGIVGVMDRLNSWKPPEWLKKAIDNTGQILGGDANDPNHPQQTKPQSFKEFLNLGELGSVLQFANLPALIIKNWGAISGFFSNLWGSIERGAQQLGTTIRTNLLSAWDNVTQTIASLPGKVEGFVSQIPGLVGNAFSAAVSAAASAMSRLVSVVETLGGQVINFFAELPGKIVGLLAGLGEQLFNAGASAMGRLLDGIRSVPVLGTIADVMGSIRNLIPNSPAKTGPFSGTGWSTLKTGGMSIAEQFNDGLKDGFQGVIQSATSLLQQVQEAVSQGILPDNLKNNLKQELKAIGVEYDQLKVQRDALAPGDKTGRKAIDDQMKQLQTLRDQLKLQQDQVSYGEKNSKNMDSMSEAAQMITKALAGMLDAGKNFVMSNVSQFENDLGISGHGAIPTIAEAGLGWGMQQLNHMIDGAFGVNQKGGGVNIHVNSVDEAMTARQNLLNKQALQYAGR